MNTISTEIKSGSFWLTLAALVGSGVALFGFPALASPVKAAVSALGLLVVGIYSQQAHQTERAKTNAAAAVVTSGATSQK